MVALRALVFLVVVVALMVPVLLVVAVAEVPRAIVERNHK